MRWTIKDSHPGHAFAFDPDELDDAFTDTPARPLKLDGI
jgi:hypothetical protein